MSRSGYVGIVLHAHLPYVRHPEHPRSLEERWLFEAIWESYLPIVSMLDRFADEDLRAPFTLSLSPPLLAMLEDDLLRTRFAQHMDRLLALSEKDARRRQGTDAFASVARFYVARLGAAKRVWERLGGRIVPALAAHADAGRVELWTSAASHAFLPGLLSVAGSVRAQLRLGLRAFAACVGRAARGLWLPECAYDPRLGADLAAAGVQTSILDGHGLELATPRPPRGVMAPILAPSGVAWFGRDVQASHDVWSRRAGYPGDPVYREFHRDLGFDLPLDALDGEIGPHGSRLATGLKYHRITGSSPDKAPYDPAVARERAAEHAEHFVRLRHRALEEHTQDAGREPPIVVAPYDAELFGHWWFEGPAFLEATLRRLHAASASGGAEPIGLAEYLARHPPRFIAEPAESTWGEGGYGDVWAGPKAAGLWRHVHHAARSVEAATALARDADGERGRALDQSIRELLLLQASDWAFMMHGGEMVEYAGARVRAHRSRAERLARIATGIGPVSEDDRGWSTAVADADRYLHRLQGSNLRDAFDPWGTRAPRDS